MSKAVNPYGDGLACQRIVTKIKRDFMKTLNKCILCFFFAHCTLSWQ